MTPHTQRLERWLGAEHVQHLSERMNGYTGGPIAVANVPGNVYVHPDGNFSGQLKGGSFASFVDRFEDARRRSRRAIRRMARAGSLHAGFSSIQDFITEATTNGKKQTFPILKIGVGGGGANIANSLWDVGNSPAAGSAATAAPGGHSPDNTTAGGLRQVDPSGGDTLHFAGSILTSNPNAAQMLLLYDRYFACNHDISVDPRTVTGTPTRYQSTAAKNTFIAVFVTTALGASTPTYTITYTDQDGNTAEASAAQTIVASSVARRFPFAATVGNGWFFPLNTPDTGVRTLTNLDLSAASTGNLDIVLCKPIAWLPCPVLQYAAMIDGVQSAFSPAQITDSSCLALMEVSKNSGTASSYFGFINLVAG